MNSPRPSTAPTSVCPWAVARPNSRAAAAANAAMPGPIGRSVESAAIELKATSAEVHSMLARTPPTPAAIGWTTRRYSHSCVQYASTTAATTTGGTRSMDGAPPRIHNGAAKPSPSAMTGTSQARTRDSRATGANSLPATGASGRRRSRRLSCGRGTSCESSGGRPRTSAAAKSGKPHSADTSNVPH